MHAQFFDFPADLRLRDADELCSLTLREVAQQRLNNHPVVQGAAGRFAKCLMHTADGDDVLHIHDGIRDDFRSKLLSAFTKADGFVQREEDERRFACFGTLAAEELEQLVLDDTVGKGGKGVAGRRVIHAGSFAQSDTADLKQVLKSEHAILMLGGKALDGESDKFQNWASDGFPHFGQKVLDVITQANNVAFSIVIEHGGTHQVRKISLICCLFNKLVDGLQKRNGAFLLRGTI